MEKFIDFVFEKPIFTILIFILIVFALIYWREKYVYTPQFEEAVGKPTKFNFWAGGCFVKIDNKTWVPCENYIGVIKNEKDK